MSEEANKEQTLGTKQEKSTELSDEQLNEVTGAGTETQEPPILKKNLEVDVGQNLDIGDVEKAPNLDLADTKNLLNESGPDDY